LIKFLVDEGILIKLNEDLLFHQAVLSQIQKRLEEYLQGHGDITVPAFKELFGFSRKYAISLLEYFDSTGLTMRVGDKRILKKRRVSA
ncbi:MAG: SelB C-terminal domain-containing protein, partial [bacterium]